MASSEPDGVTSSRGSVDLRNQCPPEFVVRTTVLKADEILLCHIAECSKCTRIYEGALGSYGFRRSYPPVLPKKRGPAGDWIARFAASIPAILHAPVTSHSKR